MRASGLVRDARGGRASLALVVFALGAAFLGALWVLSLLKAFGPIKPPGPQPLWDAAQEANVWTWGNACVLVAASLAAAIRAAAR